MCVGFRACAHATVRLLQFFPDLRPPKRLVEQVGYAVSGFGQLQRTVRHHPRESFVKGEQPGGNQRVELTPVEITGIVVAAGDGAYRPGGRDESRRFGIGDLHLAVAGGAHERRVRGFERDAASLVIETAHRGECGLARRVGTDFERQRTADAGKFDGVRTAGGDRSEIEPVDEVPARRRSAQVPSKRLHASRVDGRALRPFEDRKCRGADELVGTQIAAVDRRVGGGAGAAGIARLVDLDAFAECGARIMLERDRDAGAAQRMRSRRDGFAHADIERVTQHEGIALGGRAFAFHHGGAADRGCGGAVQRPGRGGLRGCRRLRRQQDAHRERVAGRCRDLRRGVRCRGGGGVQRRDRCNQEAQEAFHSDPSGAARAMPSMCPLISYEETRCARRMPCRESGLVAA